MWFKVVCCVAEVRFSSVAFAFILAAFHHLFTGLHTWVWRRARAVEL